MLIVNDIVENNTTKAMSIDIILWNTFFIVKTKIQFYNNYRFCLTEFYTPIFNKKPLLRYMFTKNICC